MRTLTAAIALLSGTLAGAIANPPAARAGEAEQRGAYLYRAAGCDGCHSDAEGGAEIMAGGPALVTPFGTFYGPNITPDPGHGIGAWSKEDFRRALREGLSPNGAPYYPAFPYTSFTALRDADMDDLWSYIKSVPAVARADRPHELGLPFNWRVLLRPWRWLFFEPGPFEPAATHDEAWNRGAYLVEAVGHCGECHSPRGAMGQVDKSRTLAGNAEGPEGKSVPNITSHEKHGIGKWSADDIATYLSFGMTPGGDFAGGAMAEVIKRSTQHLSVSDRSAIALYLKSSEPYPLPDNFVQGGETAKSAGMSSVQKHASVE